ncbi:MAG: hypothetical protein R2734_13615 [Nocardioides sp.]
MDDVKDFPSRSFLRYWRANLVSSFGTYVTPFALQAMVVLAARFPSAAESGLVELGSLAATCLLASSSEHSSTDTHATRS